MHVPEVIDSGLAVGPDIMVARVLGCLRSDQYCVALGCLQPVLTDCMARASRAAVKVHPQFGGPVSVEQRWKQNEIAQVGVRRKPFRSAPERLARERGSEVRGP